MGHVLRLTEAEASVVLPRVAAARSKGRAPFRTRQDGYRAARRAWICTDCLTWHDAKAATCAQCGRPTLQHFASQAEAKRYAALRLMQREGYIEALQLQPRFDVLINGLKVCTYVADFRYRETSTGETITEDAKGSRAHQDPASALRRRCAEAYHAMTVRLVVA